TFIEADRMKGDTSQNLIGLLERRLDMIVYRAKFAPTIWAARQLVSHGHIRVNGVKCNIASRRVNVGDEITLGNKAQEMALVMEAQGLAEREIPDYVAPDGTAKATFTRIPTLDEVPYPVRMEPNLVVEFYSR
ncbi:MAG: small subunit ribosomal protein, partial [Sphingomonadales bacterium]|nr:small subunit ribosomal protein [Sphingomonadales bacterium]